MLITRRQRVYPSTAQVETIDSWDDPLRAIHNAALEERKNNYLAYKRWGTQQYITYESQSAQLTQIRAELDWVRAVPAAVAQQMLLALHADCQEHGSMRMKYWAKRRHEPSYKFPDPKNTPMRRVSRKWGEVRIPKLGWVKFKWTRDMTGTLRNVILKKTGERWHFSFLYETGTDAPPPRPWTPEEAAGVDVGVVNCLVVVDISGQGLGLDRTFVTPKEAERLNRLLRQQARRRRVNRNWRESKNYVRTQQQIKELYDRQKRRRRDFQNQVTSRLVRAYPFIAIESLNVRGMTKSASGTVENPGKNVRQKTGLNRAILDKAWGQFKEILTWQGIKHGCTIQPVSAVNSSRECPLCEHTAKENRENQAVFECVVCSFKEHADTIGAWNTRERGVILAFAPGNRKADTPSVGWQAALDNTSDNSKNHLGIGGDPELLGSTKRQPLKLYTYLVNV